MAAAQGQCWLLQQLPRPIAAALHPFACGSDGGVCHLRAEAAEGQLGHCASWEIPPLLLLLEGPARCKGTTTWATLRWSLWLFAELDGVRACPPVVEAQVSPAWPCKYQVVGFPANGLGPGKLLSADLA